MPNADYLDLVFFFYGLAFFTLGMAIFLYPRQGSEEPLAKIIWLLGIFGILHGFNEWTDLWMRLHGESSFARLLGNGLTVSSFVFLFEFGRRCIRLYGPSHQGRRRLHWLTHPLIYLPLLGGVLVGALAAKDFNTGLQIWTRYLVALPGGLLTGLGLILFCDSGKRFIHQLNLRPRIIGSGVTFKTYAIAGGLVGPAADFFPANLINQTAFLDFTGIPIQVVRALCAVIAAFLIIRILKLFDIENQERLKSAMRETQQALSTARQMHQRNEKILLAADEALLGVDMEGRVTFANPTARDLLGHEEDSDLTFSQLVGHDQDILDRLLSDRVFRGTHEALTAASGRVLPVDLSSAPVMDDDGSPQGWVIAFRDISYRLDADKTARLSEQILRNTREGIIATDPNGRIRYVNPAFEKATGYTLSELIGEKPDLLHSGHQDREFYRRMWESVRAEGQWKGEIWNRRKSGEIYPEWLTLTAIRDQQGNIIHYVGQYSDINTQKEVRQRLHSLAYYDELTGLPNRALFQDRLAQVLAQARRYDQRFAVLFMDMDNFKHINDSLGHRVGDQMLQAFAKRISASLREEDTVARLGGDEFVIIQRNLNHPDDAGVLADKVLQNLAAPYQLDQLELRVGSSIGISIYPDNAVDAENLIKFADTAMYRAKAAGRGTYKYYSEEMSLHARDHLALLGDLRRALETDQLQLHYQPQIDLKNNRLVGLEALARWIHPERGWVSPATFIPLAEENGLIRPLGLWALKTACAQLRQWHDAGLPKLDMAVNISAHQFRAPDLLDNVVAILEEYQLAPEHLTLELTESTLMGYADKAVESIRELSRLGIKIAIDDFGTGYSSLGYLKRFAIDKLKIDTSFVRDIPHTGHDVAIAEAILALGRALDLRVVAEGVENLDQLDFFRRRDCDEVQGYLFSKAVPAEEIPALVAQLNGTALAIEHGLPA